MTPEVATPLALRRKANTQKTTYSTRELCEEGKEDKVEGRGNPVTSVRYHEGCESVWTLNQNLEGDWLKSIDWRDFGIYKSKRLPFLLSGAE